MSDKLRVVMSPVQLAAVLLGLMGWIVLMQPLTKRLRDMIPGQLHITVSCGYCASLWRG